MPYLLQDHDGDTGICLDFITEALSRVDEDESILPIFSRAIEEVSQRLSNMTMDDDYKPYINVGTPCRVETCTRPSSDERSEDRGSERIAQEMRLDPWLVQELIMH